MPSARFRGVKLLLGHFTGTAYWTIKDRPSFKESCCMCNFGMNRRLLGLQVPNEKRPRPKGRKSTIINPSTYASVSTKYSQQHCTEISHIFRLASKAYTFHATDSGK